jgi:hypothetical protein
MVFSGDDLSPVVSAVQVCTLLKPHNRTAIHENPMQKTLSLGPKWAGNKHIFPFMLFSRTPDASQSVYILRYLIALYI